MAKIFYEKKKGSFRLVSFSFLYGVQDLGIMTLFHTYKQSNFSQILINK